MAFYQLPMYYDPECEIKHLIFACNVCKKYNDSFKPICCGIRKLALKERAIIARRDKNNEIRKSTTTIASTNYLLRLLIIENYNSSYKDLCIIINGDNEYDVPNQIEDYVNYKVRHKDAELVRRIKAELSPIYNAAIKAKVDPLTYYLSKLDYTSFSLSDLETYVKAINYYHTSCDFNLILTSNPHKPPIKVKCDWDSLYNTYFKGSAHTYRGNDTKFLARFQKQSGIPRSTLTKLFNYYNDSKYFTYDDLYYIRDRCNKLMTMTRFIEIINNICEMSKKI